MLGEAGNVSYISSLTCSSLRSCFIFVDLSAKKKHLFKRTIPQRKNFKLCYIHKQCACSSDLKVVSCVVWSYTFKPKKHILSRLGNNLQSLPQGARVKTQALPRGSKTSKQFSCVPTHSDKMLQCKFKWSIQ